jgi:hypothetical protein
LYAYRYFDFGKKSLLSGLAQISPMSPEFDLIPLLMYGFTRCGYMYRKPNMLPSSQLMSVPTRVQGATEHSRPEDQTTQTSSLSFK